jgi:hypothetical protein
MLPSKFFLISILKRFQTEVQISIDIDFFDYRMLLASGSLPEGGTSVRAIPGPG